MKPCEETAALIEQTFQRKYDKRGKAAGWSWSPEAVRKALQQINDRVAALEGDMRVIEARPTAQDEVNQ